MNPELDWLNSHINRMQQDIGLASVPGGETYASMPVDVAMLEIAALLTGTRPGAAEPDAGFLGRLRERVLASIDESDRH